ncbi:hypothetical protein BJF79_43710 [Actinomadura sp. CNU-125]|nr:hypothetical protein BJF79_43710 [Actinomadura sp. CNU-125]
MPFISQPRTRIASPAPASTSRRASVRYRSSYRPAAPCQRRSDMIGCGTRFSFCAIIGTLSTSMRRGSAFVQRAHGPMISGGPSMAFQLSPGR